MGCHELCRDATTCPSKHHRGQLSAGWGSEVAKTFVISPHSYCVTPPGAVTPSHGECPSAGFLLAARLALHIGNPDLCSR